MSEQREAHIGYIIELIDITDLLDNQTDCNVEMVK